MKLWICSLALSLIAFAGAAAKAGTLDAVATGNAMPAAYATFTENHAIIAASMAARDVPEPGSILLLATGLISLALLGSIGRPPFRLKF